MVDRISLRVHAAAPSSRTDDRRFQAQAEAYANFAPTHQRFLTSHHASGSVSNVTVPTFAGPAELQEARTTKTGMMPPAPSTDPDATAEITWDPTTFLEDTQLGYSALESQLITSSLRVAKSSRKRSHQEISSELDILARANAPSSVDKLSPIRPEALERQDDQPLPSRSLSPESASKKLRLDRAVVRNLGVGRGSGMIKGHGVNDSHSKTPTGHSSQANITLSPHGPVQSSYLVTPVLDRTRRTTRSRKSTPDVTSSESSSYFNVRAREEVRSCIATRPAGEVDLQPAVQQSGTAEGMTSQQSSVDNDATSELPTSYSLSDITSGSSRNRQRNSVQRSISDPGPAARDSNETLSPEKSSLSDIPSPLKDAALPTPQPIVTRAAASPVVVKDFAIQTKGVPGASRSPVAAVESPAVLQPITIRPPPPEVGLGSLESQVTPSLKWLAESPKLSTIYNPVHISRELRATERGHWFLNTSLWTADVKARLFTNLEPMITAGSYGWGVWCTRAADGQGADVVKVYCWGEIVKHMYLVLYLASMSRARKTGLQWIDAEGKVVVQMRSS